MPTRREFLKAAGAVTGLTALAEIMPNHLVEAAGELPYQNGKYQTFFRISPFEGVVTTNSGEEVSLSFQPTLEIDLGTLGPDVDTIAGIDFQGNIPTGAQVIFQPKNPTDILETRVVFIKRTDIETVQLTKVLGGDRFDVYQISKFGGDPILDAMAHSHATNTARLHQKVVYLGDLGQFETQWGNKEKPLLQRMIRAQRPGKPNLGIPDPDFVNPRVF